MKKFKVSREKWRNFKIEEVAILSETDKMVTLENNRKESKDSSSYKYADTIENAQIMRNAIIQAQIRGCEAIILYNQKEIESLHDCLMTPR